MLYIILIFISLFVESRKGLDYLRKAATVGLLLSMCFLISFKTSQIQVYRIDKHYEIVETDLDFATIEIGNEKTLAKIVIAKNKRLYKKVYKSKLGFLTIPLTVEYYELYLPAEDILPYENKKIEFRRVKLIS